MYSLKKPHLERIEAGISVRKGFQGRSIEVDLSLMESTLTCHCNQSCPHKGSKSHQYLKRCFQKSSNESSLKCTVECIHKWTNIELTDKGSPLTSLGDVSKVTTTKCRYIFSVQNRERREDKSYPIRVYYSGYIKEHPSESTVILSVSVVQT